MRAPDEIRKCVVFLGTRDHAKELYVHRGTAFFINREIDSASEATVGYLVTARHNLTNAMRLGLAGIHLRVNTKDGRSTWIDHQIPLDDWICHPDSGDGPIPDIAAVPMDIDNFWDHLAFPIDEKSEPPDFGDEVFTVGLFWPHPGKGRASPVVRVGHVAAIGEDLVSTKCGPQNAYLIEQRSLAGLSGSPVFNWSDKATQHYGLESEDREYYLMGVNIAHFLSSGDDPDFDKLDAGEREAIDALNAGLAVVVKRDDLISLVGSREMKKLDEPRSERILKTYRPGADLDRGSDYTR